MITDEHEVAVATDDLPHEAFTLRGHVVAQLDHVTPEERAGVYEVVEAFARDEGRGERLPGPGSVFTLQAAPELLVFVRREPGAPVEVFDIMRPAAVQAFADAARR